MSTATSTVLPDWARALAAPQAHAEIRRMPEDFRVSEALGFELSDEGEHDFLYVEKTGLNTNFVATKLASFARLPQRAVGFAGMKDRHAVSCQWFSVQRPAERVVDWSELAINGLRILRICRHRKKLKRGAHRMNRFRIVLRELTDSEHSIAPKLRWIRDNGMPNYFGEQRFGRGAANLQLADSLFDGQRLPRQKRSIALSAARSLVFNALLSARVADGTWNTLIDGDVAGLDGTGSVFDVDDVDDELRARCASLDIHPTGPLWGAGAPRSRRGAGELERRIAAGHTQVQGLELHTKEMRRPLRCRVHDLEWLEGTHTLTLTFALNRGSFATALLRELIIYDS